MKCFQYAIMLAFIVSQIYADSAFGMAADEHAKLTNEYGGGSQYYQNNESAIKSMHSQNIDKIPWRSHFPGHQKYWGHSEAWYYGEDSARDIIAQDLISEAQKSGRSLTYKQAMTETYNFFPPGGGRELLIDKIQTSYPGLLTNKEAIALADQVYYSHLKGDMTEYFIRNNPPSLISKIENMVKYPPCEYLAAKVKLDIDQFLKTTKLTGGQLSGVYAGTIPNYERWFIAKVAQAQGFGIYNIPEAKTFGLVINGKNYLLSLRTDTNYIIKMANKNTGNPVLVNKKAFDKLRKNPQGKRMIKLGLIQRVEDYVPQNIIEKYTQTHFHTYVENTIKTLNKSKTVQNTVGIINVPYKNALAIVNAVNIRYAGFMNRLPNKLRMPVQAGIMAGLVSGSLNTYKVIKGDLEVEQAALSTIEDSALAAGSIYISDAFVQSINNKTVITAFVKKGSPLAKAFGAGLKYGVTTFIFDETRVLYGLIKGEIDERTFIRETGKALLKSGATYAATYGAVALKFSSGGPVVMAVAVGAYVLVEGGISQYEEIDNKNYVYIEDVLGRLPLQLQQRLTPYDRGNKSTPWEKQDRSTPWEPAQRRTPWD